MSGIVPSIGATQTEWRWASETGANGMITVEEAEWLGYQKVAQHPLYPKSWLMRRDG